MADIIDFPGKTPDQHTVLLVDDEYLVRGVLAEILKDCGFQVLTAASSADAIRHLVNRESIDVVFSDIKMPGMDGFELAKWVHAHKPEIPVILASGYSGKTNMAADLCGAEFLRKPFDFDNVIDKIRETIARRKVQGS